MVIDLQTIGVMQLAARWHVTPPKVIDLALQGRLRLYMAGKVGPIIGSTPATPLEHSMYGGSPALARKGYALMSDVEALEATQHESAISRSRRPDETTEQRQERRYQMCIDAGLKMPNDTCKYLPRGVGKVAKQEGVSRPTFTQDLKTYIARIHGR